MTELEMPRKTRKDLQTIVRTLQASGEFGNTRFVNAPWYKRVLSAIRMRYYRARMKKLLSGG